MANSPVYMEWFYSISDALPRMYATWCETLSDLNGGEVPDPPPGHHNWFFLQAFVEGECPTTILNFIREEVRRRDGNNA